MKTARSNTYKIFEVISETAKMAKVRELTSLDNSITSIKKQYLEEDKIVPLTIDNCQNASTILNIQNPEWGVTRFTFDPVDGFHTHGTGCNSALLSEGEFKFWRVITTKKS